MQFPLVRGRSGARVAAAPLAPPEASPTDGFFQHEANVESTERAQPSRTSSPVRTPTQAVLEMGTIIWPAMAVNPAVPDVPEVPQDAVVVVEHPDGSTEVGIDCARLPKRPGRARAQRSQPLDNRMNAEAAAAFDALRQQQAEIYRTTVLRRRRIVFLVLITCDGLFFLASLLYQLATGGIQGIKRKGLSLTSSEPVFLWLDPKELTLEEMALSVVVDLAGVVAGLQDKTYLVGLFVLLETIATVLVCLRGFSLFLIFRFLQLLAALMLRSAIFHYLKLVLPESEIPQFESMFIGFCSYMHTIGGFCGVLCGRDSVAQRGPTRSRTQELDELTAASTQPSQAPPGPLRTELRRSELGATTLEAAVASINAHIIRTSAEPRAGQEPELAGERWRSGAATAMDAARAEGREQGEARAQAEAGAGLRPSEGLSRQQQPQEAGGAQAVQNHLRLQQQPGGVGGTGSQAAAQAGGALELQGQLRTVPVRTPMAATVAGLVGQGGGWGSGGVLSPHSGLGPGLAGGAASGTAAIAAAAPAPEPNMAAVTVCAAQRVSFRRDAVDGSECQTHLHPQQPQHYQPEQQRAGRGVQPAPFTTASPPLQQQLRRLQQQLQLSRVQQLLQQYQHQYQQQRQQGRQHALHWPVLQGPKSLGPHPDPRSNALQEQAQPRRPPQLQQLHPQSTPNAPHGASGALRTTAMLPTGTGSLASNSGHAIAEGSRSHVAAGTVVAAALGAADLGGPVGLSHGLETPGPGDQLVGMSPSDQRPGFGCVGGSPERPPAAPHRGAAAGWVTRPAAGQATSPAPGNEATPLAVVPAVTPAVAAAAAPAAVSAAAAAAAAPASNGRDADARAERTAGPWLQPAGLLRSLRDTMLPVLQFNSPGVHAPVSGASKLSVASAAVAPSVYSAESWIPAGQHLLGTPAQISGSEAALLALAAQQHIQQQAQLALAGSHPGGTTSSWYNLAANDMPPHANMGTTANTNSITINSSTMANKGFGGIGAAAAHQAPPLVPQPQPCVMLTPMSMHAAAPFPGAWVTDSGVIISRPAAASHHDGLEMSGAVAAATAAAPVAMCSAPRQLPYGYPQPGPADAGTSAAAVATAVAECAQRGKVSRPLPAALLAWQEAGADGGRPGLGAGLKMASPPAPSATGVGVGPSSPAALGTVTLEVRGTGQLQGGLHSSEPYPHADRADAEVGVGVGAGALTCSATAAAAAIATTVAGAATTTAAPVPAIAAVPEASRAVVQHTDSGPAEVSNASKPRDVLPARHPAGAQHLAVRTPDLSSPLSAVLRAALVETQRLQHLAAARRQQQQQQQALSQVLGMQQRQPLYYSTQQELGVLSAGAGPAPLPNAAVQEEVPLKGVAAAARAAAAPFSRSSTRRISRAALISTPVAPLTPAAEASGGQGSVAATAGTGPREGQAPPCEQQPHAVQVQPPLQAELSSVPSGGAPAASARGCTVALGTADSGAWPCLGTDHPAPELGTSSVSPSGVPRAQQLTRAYGGSQYRSSQQEIWADEENSGNGSTAAMYRYPAPARAVVSGERAQSVRGASPGAGLPTVKAGNIAVASTAGGARAVAALIAATDKGEVVAAAAAAAAAATPAATEETAAAALPGRSPTRIVSHPIVFVNESADLSEWIAGSAAAVLSHDSCDGGVSTGTNISSGGGTGTAPRGRHQGLTARADERLGQVVPAAHCAVRPELAAGPSHGAATPKASPGHITRFKAISPAAVQANETEYSEELLPVGQRLQQHAGGSNQARERAALEERRAGRVGAPRAQPRWPAGLGPAGRLSAASKSAAATGSKLASRSVRLSTAGVLGDLSPERR